MEKIAVIYKSKYGSTEKYAKWIAEEVNGDLINYSQVKSLKLQNYDVVIYGGGLYAGNIAGMAFIKNNLEKLKGKNIIVFSCGLSNPKDKGSMDIVEQGIDRAFTKEMKKDIKFFYFRGGIDYSKMTFIHKLMMKMVYKILSKKDSSTLNEGEKEILDAYGKTVDYTDRNAIKPLIQVAQGI